MAGRPLVESTTHGSGSEPSVPSSGTPPWPRTNVATAAVIGTPGLISSAPSLLDTPTVPSERPAPARRPLNGTYRTFGPTPLGLGVVTLGVVLAAIVVNVRLSAARGWRSDAYLRTVMAIAPVNFSARLKEPFGTEARIGVALAILALLLVVGWTVAVAGARKAHQKSSETFLLGLVGYPMVFSLPLWLGQDGTTDLKEARTRVGIALLFALVGALARVIVTHRVWTIEELPAPALSLLVSLPAALGYIYLTGQNFVALMTTDERGKEPAWRSTEFQERMVELAAGWAFWATLAMLATVTVIQHIRMTRERKSRRTKVPREAKASA